MCVSMHTCTYTCMYDFMYLCSKVLSRVASLLKLCNLVVGLRS